MVAMFTNTMANFNQPFMYNQKQMGSFYMFLPFPSLKFVSIGEQTPPSQSILKISDERINMYNNLNLLRELKYSHINGTLCPKPDTPVVASLFPNPNTTGAAYAPIYHSPYIENSAE